MPECKAGPAEADRDRQSVGPHLQSLVSLKSCSLEFLSQSKASCSVTADGRNMLPARSISIAPVSSKPAADTGGAVKLADIAVCSLFVGV